MPRRSAHHEVCGKATNVDAIQHEADMVGFDMLAANFQAVPRKGFRARLEAVEAFLDAIGDFLIGLVVDHVVAP